MTYKAIITSLTNVRKHPNADRLQLANAGGHQVVVGLDVNEGDIGIMFPVDGQLSEEMCKANDLVRYRDKITGEQKGGFFEKNRRVRSQRIRGENSDGFWTKIEALSFTGADLESLKEGQMFSELNGIPICNKYFTPATLRARNSQGSSVSNPLFMKHVNTLQLRNEAKNIPSGSVIYFTEKLHGTSGRFGFLKDLEEEPRNWLQKLLRRPVRTTEAIKHFLGTRNTVLSSKPLNGQYADGFRFRTVENLVGRLHEGEIIYYELVGYDDNGSLIMSAQDTSKLPYINKEYGPSMSYTYSKARGECELRVYRIINVLGEDKYNELTWPQVKRRCAELGLLTVPDIRDPFIVNEYTDIEGLAEQFLEGPSVLDSSHIKEGVSIRVERPDGRFDFLKMKSFTFGILEGYLKDNPDFIDLEEVS